jgi:pimeloyl-ACP methyl ester carboxylesterase
MAGLRSRRATRRALGSASASAAWFATGADLPRIRAPTLVGGALQDRLIPPANPRVLARGIAGAGLVPYPVAAHGFLVQDWRRFGARVVRFFNRRA